MSRHADKWLKECLICNVGLCTRIKELVAEGKTERQASREMEQEQGEPVYTAEAILQRYRYHTNKKGACQSDTHKKQPKVDVWFEHRHSPPEVLVYLLATEEVPVTVDWAITRYLVALQEAKAAGHKEFEGQTIDDVISAEGWIVFNALQKHNQKNKNPTKRGS